MKHKSFLILGLLIASVSLLQSQSVNVPLEHWAYDFLDRLQTKGFVRELILTSKPYSRHDVARMLAEAEGRIHSGNGDLSSAEAALFEQLKGEFHEELAKLNVEAQRRYHERHLLQWREDDNRIKADLRAEQSLDIGMGDRREESETVSQTTLGGIIRGQLKDNVGFFLFAKNTLIKGQDITDEHFDPSLGAPVSISGKNAYTDDATAYIVYSRSWFRMELGRGRAQWGPGVHGSLMLSAQNPRFDFLKLQVQFKRFRFVSIHGKLNSGIGTKYLAAHRLELRIARWLTVGGSELVIYGDRGVEPMYFNPLMPYHIAEHHLGDKDNNTLGFDVVAFPCKNHKLYCELFIDDFTLAKNPFTYYGNKFAFLTGWRWVSPFGLSDADLTFEYTRVEPYVYTHYQEINVYSNYDQSIGHWLGPNSDDLFFRAGYLINRDLRFGLISERIRHGEGDLDMPHDESMGTRKRFLSGIVETQWRWGLDIRIQLFRDAFLTMIYNYLKTRNTDGIQGKRSEDHTIRLHFLINY